jgi:hypothetical protein
MKPTLTAEIALPVLEQSASLAEAAKTLGVSKTALYHLERREPEIRAAYRAAKKRGEKVSAANRRRIGSVWTRGNARKAAE